jgi:type I restriction enzyme, R subunit
MHDHAQEALAIFSPKDVKAAMTPKEDELPRLQTRHAAAMRFFAGVKDKRDLDRCVLVLEPEDVRAQFQVAFRRFAQSMDMLLPDPRALDYVGDLQWLGKIRAAAKARYRDESVDVSDCGDKVRMLIDQAIVAEGIEIFVKQVNLFSPDFDKRLEALKSPEGKASEMEHAIKAEIHAHIDEDPAFYRSLRERLEQILKDYKARRIDAAKQMELFAVIEGEMRKRSETAQDLGLSETALAIYGLLMSEGEGAGAGVAEGAAPYGALDEAKKALAENLEDAIQGDVRIVDGVGKEDVQRDVRRRIKRHLDAAKYAEPLKSSLAARMLDLLKVWEGR